MSAKKPAAKSVGIDGLAKIMNLKEATVRGRLRAAGLKKTGKAWSWPNMAAAQKVAKQLSTAA